MNRAPIIVIVPHENDRPSAPTAGLVACARKVATLDPGPIQAVLAGGDPLAAARETARGFALPVMAQINPGAADECDPAVINDLAALIADRQPHWVLVADTTGGRHLAGALATRLKAACIGQVVAVSRRQGHLVWQRAVYGGKFLAAVRAETPTTVVTVSTGAFRPPDSPRVEPGRVEIRSGTIGGVGRHLRQRQSGSTAASDLTAARLILAVGNGIGEAANIALVQQLAALLPGAALAGSRPVCDRGWLPYSRQVGLTGATVSPTLYLACGISGAPQHLAGMSGAGVVVAINKDPDAAIFRHADLCVVEDLITFLPLLSDACRCSDTPPGAGMER